MRTAKLRTILDRMLSLRLPQDRLKRSVLILTVTCLCAVAIHQSTLATARAASGTVALDGQWLIDKTAVQGTIRLTIERGDGSWTNFTTSLDLPVSQFTGLSDAILGSAGTQGQFELQREAGTLQCEGWFKDGNGSGHFRFVPSQQYAGQLSALGYSDLSDEKLLAMAVYDVSLEFIHELQTVGYAHVDTGKLLAMRIHNVTPDFIREVQSLGYEHPSEGELIAMRIHGVTPDFVRDLGGLGYNQVPLSQLVAMKIHGVDTEFIKELKGVGYREVPVEQLVAMKIHGVTIDYIKSMQGRGMGNLSVAQLISLKTHGL